MQIVDSIFQKLGLHVETAELIRSKAGVSVYRLEPQAKS